MNPFLEKVEAGFHLTREESKDAVLAMMNGSWEASESGRLLQALHRKGETTEELIGFAQGMRERSVPVPLNGVRSLDTCGTGGDRKNTFNVSTICAFVLAGCGIPIAKHGNRAASSLCGSADLLEALGIRCRLHPEEARSCLEKTGFSFLFAPDYHPATRSVVAIRKALGTPTIFNLLGPLTNPAFPVAQLVGVYDPKALPLMEEALRKMDPDKRAFLVHSESGYDEATPLSRFMLLSTFAERELIHPQDLGFEACSEQDLAGGSPQQNATIAMEVLAGEKGPKRDTVLLNALFGYIAFHPDASIENAKEATAESIDSGAALRVVQRCQELFPL